MILKTAARETNTAPVFIIPPKTFQRCISPRQFTECDRIFFLLHGMAAMIIGGSSRCWLKNENSEFAGH